MTTPPAPRPDRASSDDPSPVPGLEPTGRAVPLDVSRDPDRFDPAAVREVPRDLDPDQDIDRFSVARQARGQGQGQSLPDLLGTAGTHEGERDGYEWAFGLLLVLAFLGAVAFLFNNVLSP